MTYSLVRGSLEISISEKEYYLLGKSRATLLECMCIEETYDTLVQNYAEWESDLLEISVRAILNGLDPEQSHEDRRLLNRRLTNVLTAARGYIDQIKHHIREVGALGTEVVAEIEREFRHQYDRHPGYMLMEALRNYIQHRGSAIHMIRYCHELVDARTGCWVKPCLRWQTLRDDPKFKQEALEGLKDTDNQVDLRPRLREYIEGLSEVHCLVRNRLQSHIDDCERNWSDAASRFEREAPFEDAYQRGIEAVACARNGETVERLYISDFLPQDIHSLQRRNRAPVKRLASRFVANW